MLHPTGSHRFPWRALLATAVLLLLFGRRAWAQMPCPTDNSAITSITTTGGTSVDPNTQNLSQTVLIYWQENVTGTTGWWRNGISLDVFLPGASSPLHKLGEVGSAPAYTNWDTTIDVDGNYELALEQDWAYQYGPNTPSSCVTFSPRISVTVANGHAVIVQRSTTNELTQTCSCVCDAVPTGSETHPLTGAQNWDVPVTGWDCRGKRYTFQLSYNSLSLVDPQSPTPPELTGLSERNSKWSQPFSQWIDLFQDQAGTSYAVWHHDGTYLSFPQSGNTFSAPDSFHTLTAGPILGYAQTYNCGHGSVTTTVGTYNSFTLKDAEQTEYDFTMLYWTTSGASGGNCQAIPHYLLTQIKDRWNRKLTITWSDQTINGNTEKRVTSVKDDNNVGLTLGYTNGRLVTVQDPQNRTHVIGYSAVLDETGASRQKLTSVTVYGPGYPNRVVYLWSFDYSLDGTTNNLAYGGTYTGDLVIRKSAPDGLVTSYRYEPVTLTGANHARLTSADWDGRATQVSWPDSSEGPTVTRTISRVKNSATQATLTLTGGNQVQYNYTGVDLTSVVDLATGRTWSYQYDSRHNLWKTWSPLEPTSGSPLVESDNQYDANGHMTQSMKQVLLAPNGAVGNPVTTLFNSLNLPTQITASPASGSGSPPLVTQFTYDAGTLSVGNLTATNRGYLNNASPPAFVSLEQTGLSYADLTGAFGLPDTSTNDMGAVSTYTYDYASGRLLTAASPYNFNVPSSSPDFTPSGTVLDYNTDGLPSMVTDPMGHTVTISYNAAAPGSANLVVTRTYKPSPFPRVQVTTLDPMGRVLNATDENGISSAWTYNPKGQVKTVTEGISTPAKPEQRTTTYHYSSSGDLTEIDLPNGGASHVNFDYNRYDQNGNPVYQPNTQTPIYEGQVTKITYPVAADYPSGAPEYFGYNNAGELAWHKKADGAVVTITRDVLHRVSQVAYPASGGNPAFTTTAAYDEFGRTTSTSDAAGTTLRTYDALSRITSISPPAPQQSLTFNYQQDFTGKTWDVFVTAGGSNLYIYNGDTKGRLNSIVTPFNQSIFFQYDPEGKTVLTTFPNGVREERCYTPQDWPASILYRQANGNVLDYFAYYYTTGTGGHDLTGHILREIDKGGRTHAFQYDNLYQLVQESHPDIGAVLYGYDHNGNRISRQDSIGTDNYSVDANNKLQWINRNNPTNPPTSGQTSPYTLFTYDANGRTIYRERKDNTGLQRAYTFSWDADDRLRAATTGATSHLTASYNGDGLRITKADPWTGTHNFSWGPGGVLADDNSHGGVYTPGYVRRQGSADLFLHGDWLGSTRYLSDGTGNAFPNALRFDAFGNRTATAGTPYDPIDLQFAGAVGYQTEYADAATNEPGVGLQYLQQRYYDPVVGRFISQDPIRFGGGSNLYEYVANDPVNGTDAHGLILDRWTSLGVTIGNLAIAGKWQEIAELWEEHSARLMSIDVQDRLLQPLYTRIAPHLHFLTDPEYAPSQFRCGWATAQIRGILTQSFEGINESSLMQTVRVQVPQLNMYIQRGWFQGWRFWPGQGEQISQTGYHEAIQIGPRVFDAITGPHGMLLADWLRRIGASPSNIIPPWP